MIRRLTLRLLDDDEATHSARAEAGLTRMRLLSRAVAAGGTIVAGGVLVGGLPGVATAARSAEQDVRILNLVLLLEELEAAFYADALDRGALRGELAEFARVVGEHERAHIGFLRKALADRADARPRFDFGDTTSDPDRFAVTAAMLEDTGIAAYNGQAVNLTKPVLKAAATIVSVEARHAAWIRDIVGRPAAPNATDTPATERQVRAAVADTGFVQGGEMIDSMLDELDRDGAIREAEARLPRGRLLALAAGAAGAFGVLAEPARGVTKGDIAILNYALALEYLQAAFYTEAERIAAIRGQAARAARVVGAVERAHVAAFRDLLGRKALKRPTFDFRGVTEDQQAFLKTAVAFEDLAVAAYKGKAHLIESDAVLAAAVSIHSVEARHAAWMRHLFGIRPAASAFDEAKPQAEVERIVQSTSFVVARPRTRAKGGPRFTG